MHLGIFFSGWTSFILLKNGCNDFVSYISDLSLMTKPNDSNNLSGKLASKVGAMASTGALVFAGGCIIYAVLFFLARFSHASPEILYLFIPLTLIWTGGCIFWSFKKAKPRKG